MPLKKNVCMIAPTISKVRNWGYDGTGLYCPNITEYSGKMTSLNFDYVNQEIDSSVEFTAIFDEDEKFDANRKILNEFEIRDKKILFRSYLKLLIYKAFELKIFQIYKKKKHKFD